MRSKLFVGAALGLITCNGIAHLIETDTNVSNAEIRCDITNTESPVQVTVSSLTDPQLKALMGLSDQGFYGTQISLPLSDGSFVTGFLTDGYEYMLRGWSGWGLLDEKHGGYFTLSVVGEALYATLHHRDQTLTVRRSSGQPKNARGGNTIKIQSVSTGIDVIMSPGYEQMRDRAVSSARSTVQIDHLYAYSNNFEAAIGNYDGVGDANTRDDATAYCLNVIANLNTIYLASGIDVTARLVYSFPINQHGSSSMTFDELASNGDGIADEIHAVRELVQADLGSYIRMKGVSGSSTGIISEGYNGTSGRWLNMGNLYQEDIGNPTGNAHEIGHNMGMAHNRLGNLTPHKDIPYAYGFCTPVSTRRTINGQPCSGLSVGIYSNPDIDLTPGDPLGIDHDTDPENSADGVRAQNFTAPFIAGWSPGVAEYPDCDGDGLLDVIEIVFGTATDCNGNSIDDACDISSGFETDCDSNGIPDSCEYSTELYVEGVASTHYITDPITTHTYDFDGIPSVNSELEITFSTNAKISGVTAVDIYVDGLLAGSVLDTGTTNSSCNTLLSDSITTYMHDGDIQTIQFVAYDGNLSSDQFCDPIVTIEISYYTNEPNDVNRNGVYDPCEPGCTPYDIAAPYDSLDYFDFSLFQGWYNNGNLLADFAEPFGTIDFYDYSAYINGYSSGCP